ncbi:ATP-dependent DNA helicase [Romboutsia lituseburensis]|uniref:ATP-dependent DNA helicase n=1 Tax=Romboutsia lituseburensis TaxID=1537 RepID=UPI00215AE6F5|nr:ATP-dependent DNA helicase [Romboutsia lituseburensis]MCR8744619.1 ATP-dependent DNA helicase [Romboutsia lituseburensis]
MFWFSDNKSKKEKVDKYEELEKLVWSFFMDEIPRLGFEQREGQEDMALDICYSIKEKKHTIVEAGVGIGKSYAYIVPLMYYNMLFNKPVLIATSTIALQEQLIKDVKKICSYIKHRPEIILAKGMTHFACRKRADEYYKDKDDVNEDEETLYKYIENGTVDRRFINLDINDDIWENVSIKATDHSKCEYFKTCRFMRLRNDMLETKGVILCNQDLLTVHFQKLKKGQKGLLSDNIDLIVIDEAHNLEDKVRSSLVESYTKNSIKNLLKDSRNSIKKNSIKNNLSLTIKKVYDFLDKWFVELNNQIQSQINEDKNFKTNEIERFFINTKNHKELIINIDKNIKDIHEKVQFYSDSNLSEDIVEELENLTVFLENLIDDKSNNLFWMEKNKGIEIFSCPKDIDKEISRLYFDKTKTTILTSATIADKNKGNEEEKYEYFIKNTGFDTKEGFLSPQKYSPFNYNENSMIYYLENMPHPTYERSDFIKKGAQEIIKLLEITKGKALILFTSKNDLKEVYNILSKQNLKYKLLVQRMSSSQDEILEEFKKDEDSVLLATGTFWEGIDIPGKALSNLIVFRLPFPVPDPIIEYKRNTCDDFLMEVSVPYMIVKLRQGVGRLIRKHDDMGIVAILDSRIGDSSNSKYKDIVFDSLPIKNRSNDIEMVRSFWNKKCRL